MIATLRRSSRCLIATRQTTSALGSRTTKSTDRPPPDLTKVLRPRAHCAHPNQQPGRNIAPGSPRRSPTSLDGSLAATQRARPPPHTRSDIRLNEDLVDASTPVVASVGCDGLAH